VQALGAAQHRGQGFQGGADDVVVGILLGEAPARGLHVGPQHGRFGVLGVELGLIRSCHRKRAARSMAISMKKFMPTPKKKAQPRRKGVNVQPGIQGRADVLQPVRQGKGRLQYTVGAGFHHVVAADADRVELGHVSGSRRR
jgi:hypothetical protein